MDENILFPVFLYHHDDELVFTRSSLAELTSIKLSALKSKFFNKLCVLSQDGIEYKISHAIKVSVDKKKSDFTDFIFFNPYIKVKLIFDSGYRKERDLDFLKQKVRTYLDSNSDIWNMEEEGKKANYYLDISTNFREVMLALKDY